MSSEWQGTCYYTAAPHLTLQWWLPIIIVHMLNERNKTVTLYVSKRVFSWCWKKRKKESKAIQYEPWLSLLRSHVSVSQMLQKSNRWVEFFSVSNLTVIQCQHTCWASGARATKQDSKLVSGFQGSPASKFSSFCGYTATLDHTKIHDLLSRSCST